MEMILLTLIKTHGGDIKGYTKRKLITFSGFLMLINLSMNIDLNTRNA